MACKGEKAGHASLKYGVAGERGIVVTFVWCEDYLHDIYNKAIAYVDKDIAYVREKVERIKGV